MKRFLLLAVLLISAIKTEAAPAVGDQLPPIELADSRGQLRPAWRVKEVTIISFCAFWCDTWKDQSQRLDSARAALRGLPVGWTMVSVDGRWTAKSRDGKWSDIARTALLDTGSRWTQRLDVRAVPTTLVVDGAGRVLFSARGTLRSSALVGVVRVALRR